MDDKEAREILRKALLKCAFVEQDNLLELNKRLKDSKKLLRESQPATVKIFCSIAVESIEALIKTHE